MQGTISADIDLSQATPCALPTANRKPIDFFTMTREEPRQTAVPQLFAAPHGDHGFAFAQFVAVNADKRQLAEIVEHHFKCQRRQRRLVSGQRTLSGRCGSISRTAARSLGAGSRSTIASSRS